MIIIGHVGFFNFTLANDFAFDFAFKFAFDFANDFASTWYITFNNFKSENKRQQLNPLLIFVRHLTYVMKLG